MRNYDPYPSKEPLRFWEIPELVLIVLFFPLFIFLGRHKLRARQASDEDIQMIKSTTLSGGVLVVNGRRFAGDGKIIQTHHWSGWEEQWELYDTTRTQIVYIGNSGFPDDPLKLRYLILRFWFRWLPKIFINGSLLSKLAFRDEEIRDIHSENGRFILGPPAKAKE